MDNLTLGKMLALLAWAITLPLWFPVVWLYRKVAGRRPAWNKSSKSPRDRGRPYGMVGMIPLVPFWMMGCADTPEAKVEKAEADLARFVATVTKLGGEISKAEKALSAEKARFEELKAKLNGLRPGPNPAPAPNPAPSPVNPTPTPGPDKPAPTPTPVSPEPEDGRFELAKAVYRIAKEVASPDRVAEAQALAGVFESVASQVVAGTLNGTLLDPQWHKISVALTAGNKPIMAAHLSAWKAAAEQLSDAIADAYAKDKLKSNSDWSDMLNEIARGLKAVK